MITTATFDSIFDHARESHRQRLIPALSFGVITRDGKKWVEFIGDAQIEPEKSPLTRSKWFDLASLTKVIFTTECCLSLVEQGRLALDEPIRSYLPDLRQYDVKAKERTLTIRQLLSHNTPLPAVEPLYTLGLSQDTVRAYILQHSWQMTAPVYSDINFILLGLIIERVTGQALQNHSFSDGLSFTPPKDHAVATEFCQWRRRILRGEVHDENAFALGGAAGHAGLFGTIDGVLDYAAQILRATSLSPATIAMMATPHHESRGLGWECVFEGWHGGEGHSSQTIGHLGFTGTGLWIDLDRGYAWSLLTNRVHPTRHRETGIMALRRAMGTGVARAFTAT